MVYKVCFFHKFPSIFNFNPQLPGSPNRRPPSESNLHAMASTTSNAVPPQAPQATGANATIRGDHRGRRGGRGGNRGGQTGPTGEGRSEVRRPRGDRGGRRDGDRRSQQNRQQNGAANPAPVDGATSHAKTSVVGVPSSPETAVAVKSDADDAAPVCFICADPVIYSAIAPCNHVTCHICALRMRALYKNKACAHCRVRSSIQTPYRDNYLTSPTDGSRVGRVFQARQ